MIPRVCSGLAGWLSRSLEPAERNAVLGDLAESGDSHAHKRCAISSDWWPGVKWSSGNIRRHGSRCSHSSCLSGCFSEPSLCGSRISLHPSLGTPAGARAKSCCSCSVGATWNWLTPVMPGFLVVDCRVRHRLRFAPRPHDPWSLVYRGPARWNALSLGLAQRTRANPHDAALFHSAFYRFVSPAIIQILFVLLPAIWGMRQGRRVARLRRDVRGFRGGCDTSVVDLHLDPNVRLAPEFPSAFGQPGLWDGWPGQVFRFLALWPAVYWIAIARRKAIA